MGIDRDDRDERQTRLDWMIDEFRRAQARRVGRVKDTVLDARPDADTQTIHGPACPATPAAPLTGK